MYPVHMDYIILLLLGWLYLRQENLEQELANKQDKGDYCGSA